MPEVLDSAVEANELQWHQPPIQWLSETVIAECLAVFDSVSSSEDAVRSQLHQCGKLLQVTRARQAANTSPELPRVPESFGTGGAVLVMKPDFWPPQCPRFCLFVLLDHDFDDLVRLGSLLRYSIETAEVYSTSEDNTQNEPWKPADRNVLRSWLDFFGQGNMLRD